MKKIFITAALLVGIVASQLIFTAQAEAYEPQNGDVAVVYSWYCEECNAMYKQVTILPNKYSDPDPRDAQLYGCHSNSKTAHKWNRTYNKETYRFFNGQWRRM